MQCKFMHFEKAKTIDLNELLGVIFQVVFFLALKKIRYPKLKVPYTAVLWESKSPSLICLSNIDGVVQERLGAGNLSDVFFQNRPL